jgi:plastocyanin
VFGAPHILLSALFGFLVWRFGSWAFWVAAVGALALLLITLPSIGLALEYPDSFYDFIGTILSIAGGLIAFVAATTGFFYEKRHVADRERSRRSVTRAMQGVTGVLAVLAIVSAILTFTGKDTVSEADKAGAIVIRMEGTAFDPKVLQVPAAQAGRVLVENHDPFVHTFTITVNGTNVANEGFTPGSEKIVSLASLAPGQHEFICEVAGHEDMKGTLTDPVTRGPLSPRPPFPAAAGKGGGIGDLY